MVVYIWKKILAEAEVTPKVLRKIAIDTSKIAIVTSETAIVTREMAIVTQNGYCYSSVLTTKSWVVLTEKSQEFQKYLNHLTLGNILIKAKLTNHPHQGQDRL